MQLEVTKGIAVAVMALATFLMGLLPIKVAAWVRRLRQADNMFCCLRCFGGGVLLATSMIHILPDGRLAVDQAMDEGGLYKHNYAIAETTCCAGIFFVYIIEELVHILIDFCKRKTRGGTKISESESDVGGRCEHTNEMAGLAQSGGGSLRTLVLIIAISFHAIFEGLAMGLAESEGYVWYLLAAISAHKLEIAFAMGLELVTNDTRLLLHAIYMGMFALMSPIGGIAGIFVSDALDPSLPSNKGVMGLLESFTAGTLIYVTFFEILFHQVPKRTPGLLKVFSIMVGFTSMALIDGFLTH